MTVLEGRIYRIGLMPIVFSLLVSCAAQVQEYKPAAGLEKAGAQQAEAEAVRSADGQPGDKLDEAEVKAPSLTGELMYDILLAEIAGQRGELDVSAPHYLAAAEAVDDPRVAARAAQIAMYAKDFDIAMRAAHRWVALEPDNLEAHKLLTALALRKDDMGEVITQMRYLLSVTDNPQEGYRLATAILARNKDKLAALTAMEELAANDPESPYAQLALSQIAIKAGQQEQALEAVERALQLQPDFFKATILKAQVLVNLDRGEEAMQLLQQATRTYPKNQAVRFSYARVLLDAEDIDGARKQFDKIVRMDPDNADAIYSLGLLELEKEHYKAAEKQLLKLLKLEQRVQTAYYYLGYAAEKQGQDDRALDWFRKVESGDFWSQSQLQVARIMVQQGKIDEMQDYLQVLRQNNPAAGVAFFLIEGEVLSDAGYLDEAYAAYTRALASGPDDEDLLYARALVAQQLGHYELAEQDMQHILDNDPENVRALNALGYTLADKTDRYDEALGYIKRALKQTPDDPAIIDSMGWVQFRRGKLDQARGFLEQAWNLTQDSEIGAHLGEVLWAQGEHDAARSIWDAAKAKDPENPVLLDVLDRINP